MRTEVFYSPIVSFDNIKVNEIHNKEKKGMILNTKQILILYRKLRRKLTLDEKIWLLDFRGDLEKYEKRLLKLAKKYEVDIEK